MKPWTLLQLCICFPRSILTHCGSKVDNKTIEGNGKRGRLQSAICFILLLLLTKLVCVDFCCSERVMVSK